MATKLQPGVYEVGETEDYHDNPVSVLVAQGSEINESRSYGLGNIIGVKSSKWYVVKVTEYLAQERHMTSGSYVVDVASMESEHDSKKSAVKSAERFV